MEKEKIKAQFAKAKLLIEQKHYEEARAVLITINHPKALEWLQSLANREARQRKQKRQNVIIVSLLMLVLVCGCGVLYVDMRQKEQELQDSADEIERDLNFCRTMIALDIPCN